MAKKLDRVMWYPQYAAAWEEEKTPMLLAASVRVCRIACSLCTTTLLKLRSHRSTSIASNVLLAEREN